MKRWEEILKEKPSSELSAKIEARVFAEMSARKSERRWWLKLASVSMGLAAGAVGYRLMTADQSGDPEEAQFIELAENELDLDTMEDLDVIEILEELEQWENS